MNINYTEKTIAIWLLICCATIFAMVILGGVTRLTGSGLSMVVWKPIMGILPPLSQAEWELAFQQYQQFPEYQIKNFHMNLAEFKTIFWFEYAHRLLGRGIGLIFMLPMLFFMFKGMVTKTLAPKLVIMFVLGGLQGLLGWYMVKSGLVDDPHVSQYRLTAHFGLAVIIYGYMFWVAIGLLSSGQKKYRLINFSTITTVLIFVTMLSGGFVAGLKAGWFFNTFPLMNGQWIPDGILNQEPIWRNFFENIITVQFDHRLLATLVFIVTFALWFVAQKTKFPTRIQWGIHIFLIVMLIQITLGISTLLLHVPVFLAAAHQGGALVLFTVALFVTHELCIRQKI
ncbi:COX15/CtaA family protein [Thiotrichales bacterium HSG1]|nr:COX15/CtaA family protein [Thiotrichales bacterium HSG1]